MSGELRQISITRQFLERVGEVGLSWCGAS
jgi:hypothetical protein